MNNASIGHDGTTRSCHSSLKSSGTSPNFFSAFKKLIYAIPRERSDLYDFGDSHGWRDYPGPGAFRRQSEPH